MELYNLDFYKELVIGPAIFFVLWMMIRVPLRLQIKKILNKSTYRRVKKQYKTMKFDRYLGFILIILGILSFWMIHIKNIALFPMEFSQNCVTFIVGLPFILICLGLYFRIVGFVKAMAGFM